MELTKEQQQTLINYLNEKWRQPRVCEVCSTNNWNIIPSTFELREFNGGGLVIGGNIIPLIVMECINCGNLKYINGIKAGIVQKKEGK
jgi:hypothetical protein